MAVACIGPGGGVVPAAWAGARGRIHSAGQSTWLAPRRRSRPDRDVRAPTTGGRVSLGGLRILRYKYGVADCQNPSHDAGDNVASVQKAAARPAGRGCRSELSDRLVRPLAR